MDRPYSSPDASAAAPSRRDFLFLTTGSMAVVGAAATIWPLIDQMNPDAQTLAASGPVDIDIKSLQPGQQIVVLWQRHPVFIVHRTAAALKTLQEPALLDRLSDPNSTSMQQPSYAVNWHRSIKPEYLVLVGVCTHLGCIPNYAPTPDSLQGTPNWLGGYLCPCHGSKYDLAGRVFRGVPAPYNLPVPPYRFANETTLRVGENPPEEKFDFNAILQV